MIKQAKNLSSGDVVILAGGVKAPLLTVEHITDRESVPHKQLVEITYSVEHEESVLLMGAKLVRNFKVEVVDSESV